jgi:tetratricopeptide (TPR) repeat protein
MRAKAEANKAIALDPGLSEAHAALAQIAMREWDLPQADLSFRRAIQLNPSNAEARHQYSHYLLVHKRYVESERESLKGLELDPMSPAMKLHLAYHYRTSRDDRRAEHHYRELMASHQDYAPAYLQFASVLYYQGRDEEAFRTEVQGERLSQLPENRITNGQHAYASGGWPARLQYQLEQLLGSPDAKGLRAMEIATTYARLGEREQAVRWILHGFEIRHPGVLELHDRVYDDVRGDACLQQILKAIGLPE